jgi:hypothetical protein
VTDNKWLSYLKDPLNERMLEFFCKLDRSMYCTAGFFNTAGKTVTRMGEIVDLQEDAVFTFEPAEIRCDENGFVNWNITNRATNRFIFKINDLDYYQSAMTRAMKALLMKIP